MSEKGIGSKLLGIFVETEEDGTSTPPPAAHPQSPADLVAELARSSGPAKPASHAAPEPAHGLEARLQAAASAGSLDFEAICRGAGMDPSDLDRVKKAEELLRSLPEATPLAVKKQIVETSLKTFGFEIEKILSAAQNQKRALDAYVKVTESGTNKAVEDDQKQIESLTAKIAQLKADIEKRSQTLASVTHSAQVRKSEVQRVIDFFQPPQPPPAG